VRSCAMDVQARGFRTVRASDRRVSEEHGPNVPLTLASNPTGVASAGHATHQRERLFP